MRKRLQRIGNSVGVVIDAPILELLGFDANGEVDMTTDGDALIVSPARRAGGATKRKGRFQLVEIKS